MNFNIKAWFERSATRAEFKRGLIEPNLLSIGLCLGLTAAYLGAFFGLVGESIVIRHGSRFLAESGGDYDFFTAQTAMRLREASADTPMLVITGASTTRAALLKSDLSAEFESRGTRVPEIYKLCASNQPVVASVALWDLIPDGATGWLVVGVSPQTLKTRPAELAELYRTGRMGVHTPQMLAALAQSKKPLPPATGIYGVDHAPFLLTRALIPFSRIDQQFRPVSETDSKFLGSPKLESRKLRWNYEGAGAKLLTMRGTDVLPALDCLREGIRKLRSRTSLRIVILEVPASRDWVGDQRLGALFEDVRGRTKALATEVNVPLVDPNREFVIPDDAFYDYAHMRDPVWTRRCANRVAERLLEDSNHSMVIGLRQ